MVASKSAAKHGVEGYAYPVYGDVKYLKYAVASATTLRRYDKKRPIALICEAHHIEALKTHNITIFDVVHPIQPEHRGIVGFKHNVHQYPLFDRMLFLDCDMIWAKNPDPLWTSMSNFPFTITGALTADMFFGAPKGFGVLKDVLLMRRKRTLKRFGLTYLSRVQSGMIYMRDVALAKSVCETAGEMLSRIDETHFQSRMKESGRSEESCEWSLAMAMSKLSVPVYPWLFGSESPQLDFIDDLTTHDSDFNEVECLYYTDPFVYSLRGLKHVGLRNFCIRFLSMFAGKGDRMCITPYVIHFGWLHQKQPFYEFSDRIWHQVTQRG